MPFLFLCEAGAKQTGATVLDADYITLPLPRARNCLASYTRHSGCRKEVRVQGLEPWTYGLKVRCSTD